MNPVTNDWSWNSSLDSAKADDARGSAGLDFCAYARVGVTGDLDGGGRCFFMGNAYIVKQKSGPSPMISCMGV
jgi:hypothetical protein